MHSINSMDIQPLGVTSGNPPLLKPRARGRGFSKGGAPLHPPAPATDTSGGPATIPPVLDDSRNMDTSGFDGSGSDVSMNEEEVERLLEKDKDEEAKDYDSLISTLETRLAATETISLRNQSNLSSIGRAQLSATSRIIRLERETVRG